MKRWLLAALLVVGVVCAASGVVLSGNPFGPASFGWTAYAPLSNATFQPSSLTWLTWAPRIGLALVAVGAGAAGAALTALVLVARDRKRTSSGA